MATRKTVSPLDKALAELRVAAHLRAEAQKELQVQLEENQKLKAAFQYLARSEARLRQRLGFVTDEIVDLRGRIVYLKATHLLAEMNAARLTGRLGAASLLLVGIAAVGWLV